MKRLFIISSVVIVGAVAMMLIYLVYTHNQSNASIPVTPTATETATPTPVIYPFTIHLEQPLKGPQYGSKVDLSGSYTSQVIITKDTPYSSLLNADDVTLDIRDEADDELFTSDVKRQTQEIDTLLSTKKVTRIQNSGSEYIYTSTYRTQDCYNAIFEKNGPDCNMGIINLIENGNDYAGISIKCTVANPDDVKVCDAIVESLSFKFLK